ncbi:MAG: HI0074 family nucleotidyltransferase substrate-binding subunit [Patescibacteria group bacterium]
MNEKTSSQAEDLAKALDRLEEALNEEKDDFVRDSVIQRFEFCFELCWKLAKNFNTAQGKETFTPKDSFRVGAQVGYIEKPEVWFEYLKARNLASHTYNEATSEKVYQAAKNFLADGRNLLVRIRALSSS